jgi:hypothetical protein
MAPRRSIARWNGASLVRDRWVNQERKQEIKGQRRHNAHIDGDDRLSVISQKTLPGLRRRLRRPCHLFRDRRLSDFEPQHHKLAMDAGCACRFRKLNPAWIRIVRQNHRIIESDVCDLARTWNVRRRHVQVATQARSREFVSPLHARMG